MRCAHNELSRPTGVGCFYLFSLLQLDMIPIDGCFEDVLQLWPLFFDVNCRLRPAAGHRRLLQGCLAAVAAVLRRRLPPAK